MFDLGLNPVARVFQGTAAKNNLSQGSNLRWQYNASGQPPPTPTGLTVVLENINNGQPPPTPTGLTVVLENLG